MVNHWGSFIWYVHKILRKVNVSYPLLRTRQRVRNVSLLENFPYVLNERSLGKSLKSVSFWKTSGPEFQEIYQFHN